MPGKAEGEEEERLVQGAVWGGRFPRGVGVNPRRTRPGLARDSAEPAAGPRSLLRPMAPRPWLTARESATLHQAHDTCRAFSEFPGVSDGSRSVGSLGVTAEPRVACPVTRCCTRMVC